MRDPTEPVVLVYGLVAVVAVGESAPCSAEAKEEVLDVEVEGVAGVDGGTSAVLSSARRAITESRLTTC
jgi:hypothetical protein